MDGVTAAKPTATKGAAGSAGPSRAPVEPAGPAEVASVLRIAVARLARRMRAERADPTMSVGKVSVLATLDRHGPLTAAQLARHERVQPPSMTRIVADLHDRGFVARTPDPGDGRQIVVSLTDAGRLFLADDRRRREEWLARRLESLTAREVATLEQAVTLLDRLASE